MLRTLCIQGRGEEVAISLQFRVLGPLDVVTADGTPVRPGSRLQRAALAALLIADGRVVSVDGLVDALWGLDPPPSAVPSLRTYLSRLRSMIQDAGDPDTRLVRRAPGYLLQVGHLDLRDFRSLVTTAAEATTAADWPAAGRAATDALALWRGCFLADFAEQSWVVEESARLADLQERCSSILVTALLRQSRFAEAAARSGDLVQHFPLRERARGLHMLALYRAGRAPEALASYDEYAATIGSGLRLRPGPGLRELRAAIARPETDLVDGTGAVDAATRTDPAARAPVSITESVATLESAARQPAPAPTRPVPARTTLVGRADELAVIDSAVAAAAAGDGCCLALTGPPGIGKTRLAGEAAERARRRGFLVAATRCPDDDSTPAWWPLRNVVVALGGDPETLLGPAPHTDADAMRYRSYEAFAGRVAAAAAERPVLLLIDDVQWIDPSSLGCLRFLAETVDRWPILIVVTARDDGRNRPDLRRAGSALGRDVPGRELELPPLDARAAGVLLNEIAAEPVTEADVVALTCRTGGNPFLLSEYARLPVVDRVAGRIPPAARGLLDRSLRRLPEPALAVLRAAAVLGDVFEIAMLAGVVGVGVDEVVDAIDAAEAASVVVLDPNGPGYRFAHALLRDELLLQMSAVRRQGWHARAAAILDERGDDAHTRLRRAQHLSLALPLVDPVVVVTECAATAHAAQDRWDWDTAADQWQAALAASLAVPSFDPVRRDDFAVRRLGALSRAGRGQTVFDDAEQSLAKAVETGQLPTIGRVVTALLRTSGGWQWSHCGFDPGPLQRRLAEVAYAVADDPAVHARVLAAVAVGNSYAADPAEPDALTGRAIRIATELGDPDVLADALLGRVLTMSALPAHRKETVDLLDRLHRLPHRLSDVDDVLRHNILTKPLFAMGAMDLVDEHLRRGIAGSARLRYPVSRVQLRWMQATMAQWRGEFDRARQIAHQAYERHRQTELFGPEICFASCELTRLWHCDRLADGTGLIADASEPLIWQAMSAVAGGDLTRARALVDRRLAQPDARSWDTLASTTLLAHAAADLRAIEPARTLLTRLAPFVDVVAAAGQTASIGPVALATGRLHAVVGDVGAAAADLAVARRIAGAGGGRVALLRTRYEQLLLDADRTDRSGEFHDIAAGADAIGMSGLAAAARRAAASR